MDCACSNCFAMRIKSNEDWQLIDYHLNATKFHHTNLEKKKDKCLSLDCHHHHHINCCCCCVNWSLDTSSIIHVKLFITQYCALIKNWTLFWLIHPSNISSNSHILHNIHKNLQSTIAIKCAKHSTNKTPKKVEHFIENNRRESSGNLFFFILFLKQQYRMMWTCWTFSTHFIPIPCVLYTLWWWKRQVFLYSQTTNCCRCYSWMRKRGVERTRKSRKKKLNCLLLQHHRCLLLLYSLHSFLLYTKDIGASTTRVKVIRLKKVFMTIALPFISLV